jgi:hypothetical protein
VLLYFFSEKREPFFCKMQLSQSEILVTEGQMELSCRQPVPEKYRRNIQEAYNDTNYMIAEHLLFLLDALDSEMIIVTDLGTSRQ